MVSFSGCKYLANQPMNHCIRIGGKCVEKRGFFQSHSCLMKELEGRPNPPPMPEVKPPKGECSCKCNECRNFQPRRYGCGPL